MDKVFKFWTNDYKHIECDVVFVEGNLIEKIWCKNGAVIPYRTFGKLYHTKDGAFMYCFEKNTNYFICVLYKFLQKERNYYRCKTNEFEKKLAILKAKMIDLGINTDEIKN